MTIRVLLTVFVQRDPSSQILRFSEKVGYLSGSLAKVIKVAKIFYLQL